MGPDLACQASVQRPSSQIIGGLGRSFAAMAKHHDISEVIPNPASQIPIGFKHPPSGAIGAYIQATFRHSSHTRISHLKIQLFTSQTNSIST